MNPNGSPLTLLRMISRNLYRRPVRTALTALGVAIGVVVALAAFLWKGDPILGVVLALSMVGTLIMAAIAGTLVPLALRWLKIDPALASSVFVTTSTDVVGFIFFLGLGTALLTRFA